MTIPTFRHLAFIKKSKVYRIIKFTFLCPHKVPKIVSDLILENYLSNPHQTLHPCFKTIQYLDKSTINTT